jgi:PEP-CTERM motif-containing protein
MVNIDISEVNVRAFSTTSDTSNSNQDKFETAKLQLWSGGLGATGREDNGNNPTHAFDNNGSSTGGSYIEDPTGDVDAALFAFNQSTTLTSLSIGWDGGNDADISVMAYTGANGSMTDPEDITNKSFLDLLDSGWEFIGHYLALNDPSNSTATINDGTNTGGTAVSSSYWLVSAYTSCADGNCNDYNSSFGNDYFKISGLGGSTGGTTGNSSSVPEPSMLLLLSIGLLGWRMNRKKDICDSLAA